MRFISDAWAENDSIYDIPVTEKLSDSSPIPLSIRKDGDKFSIVGPTYPIECLEIEEADGCFFVKKFPNQILIHDSLIHYSPEYIISYRGEPSLVRFSFENGEAIYRFQYRDASMLVSCFFLLGVSEFYPI